MSSQAETSTSDDLTVGVEDFNVAIDRDAEVPIGVQLAWALRARIQAGQLRAGQRLPGLREVAEATGVNVNTVRSVYQRLDREGLIDSQQGSGTFVAPTQHSSSGATTIAANAAQEARERGVEPREVAAALYIAPESSGQPIDAAAGQRRSLRRQIAALEQALAEIETSHPGIAPRPRARAAYGPGAAQRGTAGGRSNPAAAPARLGPGGDRRGGAGRASAGPLREPRPQERQGEVGRG